jgi:hypothetical protein
MKIVIVIDRYSAGSQRDGILMARIKQEGRYGKDLLAKRSLTSLDSAKRVAASELRWLLEPVGIIPDVEFEVRA